MTEAARLFIDVDGHPDEKGNQRHRELGYTFYVGNKLRQSGSLYFIDPPGSSRLTLKTAHFTALKMHGLPLNPGPGTYGKKASVYYATDLKSVTVALCKSALKAVQDKKIPLHVFHKGGDEGKMLEELGSAVTVVDLAKLGCPRVDKIAAANPQWVVPHCPHHAPTRKAKKLQIVHCPRLETQLFGRWYSDREIKKQAPEIVVPTISAPKGDRKTE